MDRKLDEDDRELVNQAILQAKRLADGAMSRIAGRMDPRGLEWHEAAQLAEATKALVYHARWMLKRLREDR